MRIRTLIFFIALITFAACHKKDKTPQEESSTNSTTTSADTTTNPNGEPACQDLPPPPKNFGWYDSLADKSKTIKAFLFDPVNPDKIIYIINGDESGYNKLYFYTIPSKQSRYVCTLGAYLPDINTKGWITFSDVNNNIFVVKDDSVTQLTINQHGHNPHWDNNGSSLYYFSEAYGTMGAQMVRIDDKGNMTGNFELSMPYFASFRKSFKVLVSENLNNVCTLKVRDMTNLYNEHILLTGPLYSKGTEFNFNNLTLDKNDEYFFWSNSNGIFRCNISSLQIDTLVKNCPNLIYRNPIVAFQNNELTYTHEIITPISSYRLFHDFKNLNMNLNTRQATEVKIYP